MHDDNKFFRWVYRLLALGGLLGFVALAGLFATSFFMGGLFGGAQTVEVVAVDGKPGAPPERLRFFGLDTLQNTGIQIVMVGVADTDGGGRGSSSYSSYSRQRNIIFIAPGDGEAKWLFPDNRQSIGTVDKLCPCGAGSTDKVQALYLETAPLDAGDDNRVQPALVRPDGSGYRALTPAPVRVIGQEFDEQSGLVGLLMEVDGTLLYRQYAMEDFAQVSERKLAVLPAK